MRPWHILALLLLICLPLRGVAEAMPILPEDQLRKKGVQEIDVSKIPAESRPDSPEIGLETTIFQGEGEPLDAYRREPGLFMGAPETYSQLEGILSFRGGPYRDGAAWGTIGDEPTGFSLKWEHSIGSIDSWSGVGWTGQCAIVRWPEKTRSVMNLFPEKKAKDGLTEVIYAALDGHIYFYDLENGEPTREPIDIGAPIKGSVSVDPRGYPLLYCGQGIDTVRGKSVPIGTRIFSLIDSSVLYFIDGHDKVALRHWYAFDAAPLVDAETDTLLQVGENGVFYTLQLNSRFDPVSGAVSVAPEAVKYVYRSPISTRPGMENSVAVYHHYACFADNSGLIQCVDINTMTPVWAFAAGDDTDASLALEETGDEVSIYTACELDLRGSRGDCHMRRLDLMTGQEIWRVDEPCLASEDSNGGCFATPAVGKGSLSDYVYFHVGRTSADGGTLFCIEKATGQVAWRAGLDQYGWSSPVCVYSDSGRGYVVVASSSGILRCLDGLTGQELFRTNLGANVEGSPAVFGNTLVVGTRGQRILAICFE